jgi:hypothetical protein
VFDFSFRPENQAQSLIVKNLVVVKIIFVGEDSCTFVKDANRAEWLKLVMTHFFAGNHPKSDTGVKAGCYDDEI